MVAVQAALMFLRGRFLSHRVPDGYEAIVEACCDAWNALTPERIRSLCAYPWVTKVASWAHRSHCKSVGACAAVGHAGVAAGRRVRGRS